MSIFLAGVEFALHLPAAPSFHITHLPALQFNEYAIYVMSCIGAWLGVSVVQLNPCSLWAKGKRKLRGGRQLVATIGCSICCPRCYDNQNAN